MMRSLMLGTCVLTLAFTQSATALAAEPSVYVRCDGKPDNMTGAETAARLLAITAVVGLLAPGPEAADASKRLDGEAGIAACTEALTGNPLTKREGEGNPIRRTELFLGRAIHQIEIKNYDAAVADARAALEAAGPQASERGFQYSLGLSQMEIEAAALVRAGKTKEAEAIALKMVAASPWDIVNIQRAGRYIGLTAEMSDAKRDYYDRAVRLLPYMLMQRSDARQWAGDFAGSASDIGALLTTTNGFFKPDDLDDDLATLVAKQAVAEMLAGNVEASNQLATKARKTLDRMAASGEAVNKQNIVVQAEELLDFQAIGRLLAEGAAAAARRTFAGRSRWLTPTPPAVATMARKLRQGAPVDALVGPLATDPDALLNDALASRAAAIFEGKDANKKLFGSVRGYVRAGDYTAMSRAVWKAEKSRYVLKKKADAKFEGEIIALYDRVGIPAGQGLLLHTALVAKSRGTPGFVLFPARDRLDTTIVRFGKAGDPGFPEATFVAADDVIAGLSADIPEPINTK